MSEHTGTCRVKSGDSELRCLSRSRPKSLVPLLLLLVVNNPIRKCIQEKSIVTLSMIINRGRVSTFVTPRRSISLVGIVCRSFTDLTLNLTLDRLRKKKIIFLKKSLPKRETTSPKSRHRVSIE